MTFSHIDKLRCPITHTALRPLAFPDVDAYASGLVSGKFIASANPLPSLTLTSVLVSEGDKVAYPVFDSIPFLDKNWVLMANPGGQPQGQDRFDAEFQRQMAIFSKMHDRWYGQLDQNLRQILQKNYYQRCIGADVLDVGNGGETADAILGPDIAAKVNLFVGLDKSYPMLSRNRQADASVLGDAAALPFTDNSFDYVLFNGVIHHLGQKNGDPDDLRVIPFVRECLRVARKGIIMFEMLIPRYAELIERHFALRVFRQMATYVFSAETLTKMLVRSGTPIAEARVVGISDVISPRDWLPPILTHEWLRVPVGVMPYSYLFGIIDKCCGHPARDLSALPEL